MKPSRCVKDVVSPRLRKPTTTSQVIISFAVAVLSHLGQSGWAADQDRSLRFAETEYGRSLDAASNGIELVAPAKSATLPFTFQARVRIEPRSFRFRNVILAVGDESGEVLWQIYCEARGGFSWHSPQTTPAVVATPESIADGQWHDVAVIANKEYVALFVDGQEILRKSIQSSRSFPQGRKLWIGQALDGSRGFDGWIDDVHLASGIQPLKNRWKRIPQTLLFLDFEESESEYLSQWTPLRSTRPGAEPWEQETDEDWMDGRFQQMDKRPAFACSTQLPNRWSGPKNLSISLAGPDRHLAVFDTQHCATTAVFREATIQTSPRRFGILQMPRIEGQELFYTDPRRVWRDGGGQSLKPKYRGYYRRQYDVFLTYEVSGSDVLEYPSLVGLSADTMLFTRRMEFGVGKPLAAPLSFSVAALDKGTWKQVAERRIEVQFDDDILQVELVVLEGNADLRVEGREARVHVQRGTTRLALLTHRGQQRVQPNALTIPPLTREFLDGGGPPIWEPALTLSGEPSQDRGAYVIDTIPVPHQNPWNALMFLSGFDFFPDINRAAICTVHGDVWIVDGIDASLESVRWKRFATGLYQPLGLKIVDGIVHVLGRDQITRLHDMNGDDEADFYENFNNDLVINGTPHAYATCLETDPAGWFYFFKCGKDRPHGGKLLRVSPDGKQLEIFASGYRHPIGLGVSPDGVVTAADNQGNWVPASSIQVVQRGTFHGYMPEHHVPENPDHFEKPLVWLPMVADNSSGGQTWVRSRKWGPLRNHMLHVSWGRCNLMAILEQQVGRTQQAAAAVFPDLKFSSGPIRPRFSPHDGQLYVCGLDGWQTAAVQDGCFQRVRYTGQPNLMPIEFTVHTDGIRIVFSEELDPATCLVENFASERWQYRWTGEYGSPEYSISDPNRIGHDQVDIRQVTISNRGRTLFLSIPNMQPAMQMHLKAHVSFVSGADQDIDIYHTVHALESAFATAKSLGPKRE